MEGAEGGEGWKEVRGRGKGGVERGVEWRAEGRREGRVVKEEEGQRR